MRRRNHIARDLRTPKYRKRVELRPSEKEKYKKRWEDDTDEDTF